MIKLSRLWGLILAVSVSCPTAVFAESISENFDNNSRLLREIQSEVDPTVRRLTPLLNTGIVVAVLVSTSSVIGVLVLLGMSVQKIQQTQEQINTIKQDAISDLSERLSMTQALVNDLQYSIQSSQDKIERISSQTPPSFPRETD
ncbi:hypothetical protein ACL6C3_00135 [Capilliphycus salinus ALCB114379]|uniref:hypothetical protein n=1 Tax=Capilliphycus salinus TaxID=2768948 RepID=UPI0039A6BE76